jgi:uncharacterized membrane protein YhaH (DUF805 family)
LSFASVYESTRWDNEEMESLGKVTFVDAVRLGFTRATDFAGRSSRAEFWYWILFLFILRLLTTTVDAFIYPEDIFLSTGSADLGAVASEMATLLQHSLWSSTMLVELLLLLPLVALTVRRFRDAGWSTQLAKMLFVANYGGLAVGFFTATTLLSNVTVGGTSALQQSDSLAAFVGLLAFGLIQLGCIVVVTIGAAQPSRPLPS